MPKFGDTNSWGRNIQRTMRLLATSEPQKRNTVRILFYGQSITEQSWCQAVADDLRTRFPNANLVIENRALGGFASQMLVKTAETDLYPFYPDLLIFHVYGAHDKYDDIIRCVRQRTTAEILQQNDHVTSPADFTEETDPVKLWPPNGRDWNAFMNHNWLPAVSKRYGTELCDQRRVWKRYLTENDLQPKQLLIDGVHLNATANLSWPSASMPICATTRPLVPPPPTAGSGPARWAATSPGATACCGSAWRATASTRSSSPGPSPRRRPSRSMGAGLRSSPNCTVLREPMPGRAANGPPLRR